MFIKYTWIIERYCFVDNEELIFAALDEKQIPYRMVSIEDDLEKIISDTKTPIMLYGSIEFVKKARRFKSKENDPFDFSTFSFYDCNSYYDLLTFYLLNKKHLYVPLYMLESKTTELLDFFKCDELFTKSNSSEKKFPGITFTKEDIGEKIDKYKEMYKTRDSEMLLVSDYKKIKREWRFVVIDREIIDGSLYAAWDIDSSITSGYHEAFVYAQKVLPEILNTIEVDMSFTLDICSDFNGNYYLLEINSFSCAGWYQCDVGKIIDKISEIIGKQNV